MVVGVGAGVCGVVADGVVVLEEGVVAVGVDTGVDVLGCVETVVAELVVEAEVLDEGLFAAACTAGAVAAAPVLLTTLAVLDPETNASSRLLV